MSTAEHFIVAVAAFAAVAYDLLGLRMFGLDFVVAGLSAIAAVLLPLCFGAGISGT